VGVKGRSLEMAPNLTFGFGRIRFLINRMISAIQGQKTPLVLDSPHAAYQE
jgi:hypothetical protein